MARGFRGGCFRLRMQALRADLVDSVLTAKDRQVAGLRKNDEIIGRGDRIRTCDLYVPNVALYQTELHPD